jgi:hypothetical protein
MAAISEGERERRVGHRAPKLSMRCVADKTDRQEKPKRAKTPT